jgi:hypothetical protein
MKAKLLILPLLASLTFGACTSVKTDDHSYTYVYQHNAQPPREVTETVTTKTTRTRYNASKDVEHDPATSEQAGPGASDGEIIENMRSDPFPPARSKGFSRQQLQSIPYVGLAVPAAGSPAPAAAEVSFDDARYSRAYGPAFHNPYDDSSYGSRGFAGISPRVVSVPATDLYFTSVHLKNCTPPPRCPSEIRVLPPNRCLPAVQPACTNSRSSNGSYGATHGRQPTAGVCPSASPYRVADRVASTGSVPATAGSGAKLACVSRRDAR